MLFWLEGDISRVSEIFVDSARRHALGNVIDSARMGRHALFGERDFILSLANSGQLDARQTAYLIYISQLLTQEGMLLREMRKVRLDAFAGDVSIVNDGWKVPLVVLSDADVLDRPVLIAENLKDAKFYMASAELLLSSAFPGYKLSVTASNGGGDTTWETVDYLSSLVGPAFLCVVDSDKPLSDSNIGQTAKKCLDALVPSAQWHRKVYVISGRMVENLIPHSGRSAVLEDMSQAHKNAHALLSDLDHAVFLYLDLKNGDSFCRFYQQGLLASANPEDGVIGCHHCGHNRLCGSVPPFGKLLGRFIQHYEKTQFPPVEYWSPELEAVAQELLTIGVSRPAARAI